MSGSHTEHPRAQALNAIAAEQRWPYTRVLDWLARTADPEKDHATLPVVERPATWTALPAAPQGILGDGETRILDLHADSASWTECERELRIPAGAQATLIVAVAGTGVIDSALNLQVEAGASLTLVRIAQLGASACAFENIQLTLASEARARVHDFNLEQGLSHLTLTADLQGTTADLQVDSLSLLCGRSRAVLQATVEHTAESATSRLEFRNALADRARRSVTGMVRVARSGQHTDSAQICRSLLLSPTAGADMRPELEIYADQVKCAHGATCGELDQTALHYLRSRGLPPLTARRLLLESFALPLLAELPPTVRDALTRACENALHRLGSQLGAASAPKGSA